MKNKGSIPRKIIIGLIGFPVVFVGILLLVLPGPGLLVIAAGLAVLALEFEFAERHLKKVKHHAKKASDKIRAKKKNT